MFISKKRRIKELENQNRILSKEIMSLRNDLDSVMEESFKNTLKWRELARQNNELLENLNSTKNIRKARKIEVTDVQSN